jgi:DNA-binding MarR family transcriptional regulator
VHNYNKEEFLTLGILETIDSQSDVTQRHLASSLGVALGLANSYLKRCVRKGLIKIEQAPANRYLYYLTPSGFAEKSRLTAEYLSTSFDFYRRASTSCTRVFQKCLSNNYHQILLCGISELAEIASLRARDLNIQIAGIVDIHTDKHEYIGLPVWRSLDQIMRYDACVFTSLQHTDELLALLRRTVPKERILIPDILPLHVD